MENKEEDSVLMEEPKKFIRVFSASKKDKPRFFDEDEQLYCCLDNHKCNGPCKDRNTDQHGSLICSEVITAKFLPQKRRRKKRFFRGRRNRDENLYDAS